MARLSFPIVSDAMESIAENSCLSSWCDWPLKQGHHNAKDVDVQMQGPRKSCNQTQRVAEVCYGTTPQ